MKLGKIIDGVPALQKLADSPLTARSLYWVSKLLSKLDMEIEFFNSERLKIFQELGKEVETDKWEILPENREAFTQRMADLLNIDIEGEIKTVKLPVTENIQLTYNEMRTLDGLVELELDAAEKDKADSK